MVFLQTSVVCSSRIKIGRINMSKKWKILINEPVDWTNYTSEIMEANNCEVILGRDLWKNARNPYTEDELRDMIKDVDGVVASSRDRFTRKVIEGCTNCRIISKIGIGTEKIDSDAATDMGVLVGFTPVQENLTSVSEHTVMVMLMLLKKIRYIENSLKQGKWRDRDSFTAILARKTIGIIGLGRVGKEVARRLSTWNVRILTFDPYVKEEDAKAMNIEMCSLDDLLKQSDFVTIHVQVTPETRGMIGARELSLMKPTAVIINTARGDVINEKEMTEALKQRVIAGAALDVLNPDPPSSDNELLKMENVLVTPHVAGWNEEVMSAMIKCANENLFQALEGKIPTYIKNPQVTEKWLARFGK